MIDSAKSVCAATVTMQGAGQRPMVDIQAHRGTRTWQGATNSKKSDIGEQWGATMRLVLTFLRNWWPSLIGFALTGAVFATALETWLFHVRTFSELLVWGAWGVLFGVLIGAVMAPLAERPTRRARNHARELIGPSATDAECIVALRGSVRGPIPADPKIRRAAARLAAGRLEHTRPRKSVILLIVGGVFFLLAVFRAAEDLSNWPYSAVGWGMLTQQVPTWRVHQRISSLCEKTDS